MISINRTRLLEWKARPYRDHGVLGEFKWVLVYTEHHPEYRGRDYEYAHTIQMWFRNRPLKTTLYFTNIASPQVVAERKIKSHMSGRTPIHYDTN